MNDAVVLPLCRILCWLFPRTLTALRRITMMLTEVWVGFVWVCTRTNKVHTFHPKVRTQYVLFSQSTYLVHTGMYCVYKNTAVDAVLCGMPVGNNTLHAWHVCSGAPILVMNCAHIGVQHRWHYFGTYTVRTGMYQSVLLYISCTGLYLVRTSTYRFRTGTY